jgi:hypothetical protein
VVFPFRLRLLPQPTVDRRVAERYRRASNWTGLVARRNAQKARNNDIERLAKKKGRRCLPQPFRFAWQMLDHHPKHSQSIQGNQSRAYPVCAHGAYLHWVERAVWQLCVMGLCLPACPERSGQREGRHQIKARSAICAELKTSSG